MLTTTFKNNPQFQALVLLMGLFCWGYLFINLRLAWAVIGMVQVKREVGGVVERRVDLWQPKLDEYTGTQTNLKIDAKAALVVDYRSGQVFYSLNPHRRLPVASLVKIMTALVTLEHTGDLESTVFVVPEEIVQLPLEGSVMGMSPGEKYNVLSILYGLILTSGNDAAVTLAHAVAGGEPSFVYLMNRRARALGLVDTHFTNASGLDDAKAYSTAYDLAVLAHYTLEQYPLLKKIAATKYYEIPYTQEHKYLRLQNLNELLWIDERVTGVKPGNTEAAGSCLVATAKDQESEREVLVIVLGTASRNQPTLDLIDYAFNQIKGTVSLKD